MSARNRQRTDLRPPDGQRPSVPIEPKAIIGGGWQKPTEQPSAHARPAGLPPKPAAGQAAGQSAGQGTGAQNPVQHAGQGSGESG